ncbi:MAG: ABC transporter substrate binding protein [Chloroflexi bacterium]|nr:ABC transporter substrate binding protein [Chloroflexota bacterium]
MLKKYLIVLVLLALLMAPSTLAQADKATVALLRFGERPVFAAIESMILHMLQVYDFITTDELFKLEAGEDIEGENLNVFWGDADFDLTIANTMVAAALDRGADVIISLSTPVTQIAVNTTLDQDEPTPIIFGMVYNPYQAGIAQSACIKPTHVTGSVNAPTYEEIFRIFQIQYPDIQRVGTVYNSADADSVSSAEALIEIAEAYGLEVESAAVIGFSDLRPAVQGLVSKEIEAIVLPVDHTVPLGLPIITQVANENLIPIFHADSPGAVAYGAAVSAGFSRYFAQGLSRRDADLLLEWRA